MDRVLLTGATGFVGSYVARRLLDAGCAVAVVCRPQTDRWRIADMAERLCFIAGDLHDTAALMPAIRTFAPRVAIHCAWAGVTNRSHGDVAQADNQTMTLALLDAAADAGSEVFVGLGSQAEYGPHNAAISETAPTHPRTAYGRAKLATYEAAAQLAQRRGLRFVWARVFSTYGPHDQPGWLLPYVIRELCAGRRPRLTAGVQQWDYLYIEDAADAIVRLALHPNTCGLYNLGSGVTHSVREVVEMLRDLIDPALPLGLGERPYGPDPVMHLEADISRLRDAIGWSPRTSIGDGLRAMLECPPPPPPPESVPEPVMSQVARCRLCKGSALKPCLTFDHAPANIQHLLTRDELAGDKPVTIQVHRCEDCGHVQLCRELEAAYYDDYLMTVSHSPKMRAYQTEQARDFVQRFGLRGKRVIEVGCGDGHFMACLRDAGADVTGLEPSDPFRKLAQERGFTVHGGYVGRDAQIPGAPYDALVTRQVLEHVPDPVDYLLGCFRSIHPGGVGLIEVPCLEKALKCGRFYDFFPDHLNYYSLLSLRQAAARAGLEVVDTLHGMDDEFNIALVRRPPLQEDAFSQLQRDTDRTVAALRCFLDECKAAGQRVAVWGAGGKGLTAMAVASVTNVDYVIDSDPHKQGRFTPVSHLPVASPDTLRTRQVDAVVVTALAYRDEVVAVLRDELGFAGTIAVLGPTLDILEPRPA